MTSTDKNQDHRHSHKSDLLNRQAAANFLNIKKSTLEAWAVRGGGPIFYKFGRAVRYRISDLEAWVDSKAKTSTSEF